MIRFYQLIVFLGLGLLVKFLGWSVLAFSLSFLIWHLYAELLIFISKLFFKNKVWFYSALCFKWIAVFVFAKLLSSFGSTASILLGASSFISFWLIFFINFKRNK